MDKAFICLHNYAQNEQPSTMQEEHHGKHSLTNVKKIL